MVLNSAVTRRQFAGMMFASFLCYLGMVMPLSSISVYVTDGWGMSNFVAGIAAGAAFFTTIVCRKPAGDRIDKYGGKWCFLHGALWYAAGGAVCLLAAWGALPLPFRLAALIGGRMILGVGESLSNASMGYWAVELIGVDRAGRVFATLGMCIYGAAAVGGAAGFYLYEQTGFFGLILVSSLAPLAGYFIARNCPEAERAAEPPAPVSLGTVMRLIWRYGLPTYCVAVGYAVVAAFISKSFLVRGWEYAGWGYSLCGCGFVVMRLLIGHLPDRVGGMPVAAVSAVVEMIGLYMIWAAPGPVTALTGAFLTGAGVSMVFPANGSEIARTVPQALRGTSLSCYNMFMDAAYGFSGPIAGLLTDRMGDGAAYFFAAQLSAVGLALILCNMRRMRRAALQPQPAGAE